ncbi:MAG: cytochrome P450 [Pseudomonadota bacterium]
MSNAPEMSVDMAAFWQDPYPDLARMRTEAPIAFVPELGATLFTKRDDIVVCEKQIDIFSSYQPQGLMSVLMGENLMRKDGENHLAERKAIFPTISPRTVREHWRSLFEADAAQILDELAPEGRSDLFHSYAMRLSGEALKHITGLTNFHWQEMDSCSQGMIDGIANYIGDKEVEARCHKATARIDAAIDDMIPVLKKTPDYSMLSVMLEAGLPMDSVRANIKLTISGGQNEPRDAIAGAIWALLVHPDQFDRVKNGEATWAQAFDEYVRWISPIGMSPRRVARAHSVRDVAFEPEERIFFMFGSANRDEDHYVDGDRFDMARDASKHIAFGAGPHFCAGAAASKSLIAEVALPRIFERLPDLALDPDEPVRLGGWAFRGVLNLPCTWQKQA